MFFTLYYPAGNTQYQKNHYWIPRPISLIATGYAHFAHISFLLVNWIFTGALWLLVGSTKIPAVVDAPVLASKPLEDSAVDLGDHWKKRSHAGEFPIVVFSHGMAGMRTSYSQYCGELASRGHVVAAIEHRDGSGPGTVIKRRDGEGRRFMHVAFEEVKYVTSSRVQQILLLTIVDDRALDSDGYFEDDYKTDQKVFRSAEVEDTVRVLRQLHIGHGQSIFELNSRKDGRTVLPALHGRLDLSNIIVAGHSYGATLALQTLANSPNPKLPFRGAIILDPGKRSGRLNEDIKVPTLIVNSGTWSREHGHFQRVHNLTHRIMNESRRGKAWFLTLLHTAHPSVTDAPLLQPWLLNYVTGASLDTQVAMKAFVDVSDDFIHFIVSGGNEVKGLLRSDVNDPDGRVVRDEQEGTQDPTDPGEGTGIEVEVPGARALGKMATKKSNTAGEGKKQPRWAVHAAPQIASAAASGNDY